MPGRVRLRYTTGKRAIIQNENGHRTRQKGWIKTTGSQIVIARPKRQHAQGALSMSCSSSILMVTEKKKCICQQIHYAPRGPDAPPRLYLFPVTDRPTTVLHTQVCARQLVVLVLIVSTHCLLIMSIHRGLSSSYPHVESPKCRSSL